MIPDYLKKELSVLFFIINKDQTTTSEISQKLELTKRTVRETLSTINTHFEEHQKLKDFVLIKKSGIIQIHCDFKSNALAAAYTLKLQLLKSSVLFNYTVLLLTRTSLTKDEVLSELFISSSYLNRLTQKLNKFFSDFCFGITIRDRRYYLIGNEMNIRLFSYLFLQDSFQDIEWPFSAITIEGIHNNVPEDILLDSPKRSSTKNRALYILYAILQTRIKKQKYITPPESKLMQTFFMIVQENFDVTLIFQKDSLGHLERNMKETEIQYFNFLSQIFISDIIPKHEKIKLGKVFFTLEHSYCALSKNILTASSILVKQKISDDQQALFIYYITMFNAFYSLVGDTIDCFMKLFTPPPSFHLNVKSSYLSLIKDKISSLTNNENQNNILANLLYTLHTSEIKSEVNLYLQLSKDFTTSFLVENNLKSFFNSKQIIITDNYSLSDIVITDTLERSTSGKKVFYLDSINNEHSWKELLYLIQDTYLDKQAIQKKRIHL